MIEKFKILRKTKIYILNKPSKYALLDAYFLYDLRSCHGNYTGHVKKFFGWKPEKKSNHSTTIRLANGWDDVIMWSDNLVTANDKAFGLKCAIGHHMRCCVACANHGPYPYPAYPGCSSVHWNGIGMPPVDPVYTKIPLGDPANTCRLHCNITGK